MHIKSTNMIQKKSKMKSIFWTLSAIVVVRELLVAIYYRSEADQRKCSAFCPCFQVGSRIFILYHWSKILRSKQTNQPTKKERANWTNKQTDESKLTFLKVIASQLPVQLRPSPLNPNKQVHTKDPFVFWQVAFRWQSWVFFWHSSISKKMGKKRKILQRKWFHESDNTFIFNFYKMKKH